MRGRHQQQRARAGRPKPQRERGIRARDVRERLVWFVDPQGRHRAPDQRIGLCLVQLESCFVRARRGVYFVGRVQRVAVLGQCVGGARLRVLGHQRLEHLDGLERLLLQQK